MKKLNGSLILILVFIIVVIGYYTIIHYSEGKYYQLASQKYNQVKEEDLNCTQDSQCKILDMCGNCRPNKIANVSSFKRYQGREKLLCSLQPYSYMCIYEIEPKCINNKCQIVDIHFIPLND